MGSSAAFDERMAAISRFAHPVRPEVLELGVGIEAWSKTLKDEDGNPIGGVIVECHAGASLRDQWGEITESPATFTVFDRYARPGHQWHKLEETDIDRNTVLVASNLGTMVRRFAAELGLAKQAKGSRKRGSSFLSGHEIDLGRYIGALVKVIAAGMAAPALKAPKPEEEW